MHGVTNNAVEHALVLIALQRELLADPLMGRNQGGSRLPSYPYYRTLKNIVNLAIDQEHRVQEQNAMLTLQTKI